VTQQEASTLSIQPFTISIPQSTLDDLRDRLARTRWPSADADAGWDYGTSLSYLQDLVNYWQHSYDWRIHEARINKLAQFKAEIDGVSIHFVHERGKGSNPTPILLTHGWPDSFYRYYKIIPMLIDPESYGAAADDSFDVIVPSIPGFGFSSPTPMTSSAVADLWAKLMAELGYSRFAAAGGDMGTRITKALALQHPDSVMAIHLSDVDYPTGQEDPSTMSEAEREFARFIQGWWFSEGAYAMMQSTKPQSLSFALNDSPVGMASWFISFINTGADNHKIDQAFGGRDDLLTNLTIYWSTQTAGSAARTYFEDAHAAYARQGEPKRSDVPAAVAVFPREAQTPREWAERTLNVRRFTKMPRGGHFAPLEEPELFVEDLRAFVAEVRRE
jgi:pimeloyl-ACP methyl ester carboxylesterase